MEQCPQCKFRYAKYPIFRNNNLPKDQLWKSNNIIWKNMFKMSIESIFFAISIFLLIFGYKQLIDYTNEVIATSCDYCEAQGYSIYKNEIKNDWYSDYINIKQDTTTTTVIQ